jgi:uncharacterized protein (TIGR00255 family)
MTAFGRGQAPGENEEFLVEIHSVNSRRIEIVINMPGDLTEFDPPLRKLISEAVSRGRISVYVSSNPVGNRGNAFIVNADVARQIKDAYDGLRRDLGYDGPVDFSVVASHSDLIVQGKPPAESEKRWGTLRTAAEAALAQLIAMKEAEGENLRKVFDDCLKELEHAVSSIQEFAPGGLERRTEKLKERIHETASGLLDNDERILREIVIFADKLDVSEEIARLESHLDQFRGFLDDALPCGRTIHFLLQEMNREINTIGAKVDDLEISRLVVHAKTELEKMREQGQNIE